MRRYSSASTSESKLTKAREQLQFLLGEQLEGIKAAGTWKNERVITSPQSMKITVSQGNQPLLNFCANNYLGLSVSILKVCIFHRLKEYFVLNEYLSRIIVRTLIKFWLFR